MFVQSRDRLADDNGPFIRYRCRDDQDQESEIRAFPPTNKESRGSVRWLRNDRSDSIDENEVGIYALTPDQGRAD
ncbi:MAG: hypothetical protein ACRERU_06155 [Methylococcales bacterium]